MNSDVAIVIVHYGDVSETIACLDSVASFAPDVDVFLSCNGSAEEAGLLGGYARKKAGRLTIDIIENENNLGFSGGCNAGITRAFQHQHYQWIWLLNNDTRLEADAFASLYACAQAHPDAIIGATVLDFTHPDTVQVAGGATYSPLTTIIKHLYAGRRFNRLPRHPSPHMDYVFGASMLVPRWVFEKTGLLQERFFLFYEELDLCLRAQKHGARLHWCRNCKIRHKGGATIGAVEKTAIYNETRSCLLFTRLHYPAYVPFALVSRIVGKSVFLAMRGKWHLIPPIWRGAADAMVSCRK